MRHTACFLSSFFFSSLLFALPQLPKARPETPPILPSPYTLCPQPLAAQEAATLLACAEPEFWHGFSDGRKLARKTAEARLTEILRRTKDQAQPRETGRIHALRAYLRLALALENGQWQILLNDHTEKDFEAAKKLDSTNKTYDTFVDTIYIAKPAAFGQWAKAEARAAEAFGILEEYPDNILSLSGTTIGFSLASGIPQRTIEAMSAWICPAEHASYCTQNTQHAPYARPGLNFHFAESYARMGMRDEAERYLKQAQNAPDFATWPYRHLVEKPLADLDAYMKYWEGFAHEKPAFDKVYGNQNYGCVMCHGR